MAAEVPTTLWVGYGSRIRGCGVCGGARGVRMRGRMLQAKSNLRYVQVARITGSCYTLGIRFMGIFSRYTGYTALYSAGS